jgi:hypothetical protein
MIMRCDAMRCDAMRCDAMRCDEEASREKKEKKEFGELIGKERESLREKMKNDTDTKIDIYIYIYINCCTLLVLHCTVLYCTC